MWSYTLNSMSIQEHNIFFRIEVFLRYTYQCLGYNILNETKNGIIINFFTYVVLVIS